MRGWELGAKARTRRELKRRTRQGMEKDRSPEDNPGGDAKTPTDLDERRKRKPRRAVLSRRSRARAIGMNLVSPNGLLRKSCQVRCREGGAEDVGRGRVAYQRAVTITRTSQTTPAYPFHRPPTPRPQEGCGGSSRTGAADQSAPCRLPPRARALALNIKTPYMSLLSAPHSTNGIDLHNKRSCSAPQKDAANPARRCIRDSWRPVRCGSSPELESLPAMEANRTGFAAGVIVRAAKS